MSFPFDGHIDLTIAGGPIRLHHSGDEGLPPILLLHGAMLDSAPFTWHHLAPILAETHRVWAIDLPRHGGSRPWGGVVDQGLLERVVEGVLDHLGLDTAPLVGLSLGGGIAIGFALNRPERVSAMVVLAPGGLDARRPAQFATWLFLQSPLLLRAITRYLATSRSAVQKSLADTFSLGEGTPGFARLVALARQEAVRKRTFREVALDDWQRNAYGPFVMRQNFLPTLHRLSVPTLWLRGADDSLVSQEEVDAAVAATHGAESVTITNAGHILALDQPDAVGQLIVDFLERRARSAAIAG